jgi:hypothetical protein
VTEVKELAENQTKSILQYQALQSEIIAAKFEANQADMHQMNENIDKKVSHVMELHDNIDKKVSHVMELHDNIDQKVSKIDEKVSHVMELLSNFIEKSASASQ